MLLYLIDITGSTSTDRLTGPVTLSTAGFVMDYMVAITVAVLLMSWLKDQLKNTSLTSLRVLIPASAGILFQAAADYFSHFVSFLRKR